jgi:hypothetical protein
MTDKRSIWFILDENSPFFRDKEFTTKHLLGLGIEPTGLFYQLNYQ